MSLGWYTVGINSAKEGLDPLLPHIAGVIENMEEATINDIKNQIEMDLNENVSKSAIMNALQNGMRLGLFNMEREFKVCREFTSKEVGRINQTEYTVMLPKDKSLMDIGKKEKTLMDYVKMQREKRRKKMYKGKRVKQTVLGSSCRGRDEVYSQLCLRCRKSIEKKLSRCARSSDMSSEEENRDKESFNYGGSSTASSVSDLSDRNSKSTENDRKVPQKSRLLVEKNPMETDPPYYDIFT